LVPENRALRSPASAPSERVGFGHCLDTASFDHRCFPEGKTP